MEAYIENKTSLKEIESDQELFFILFWPDTVPVEEVEDRVREYAKKNDIELPYQSIPTKVPESTLSIASYSEKQELTQEEVAEFIADSLNTRGIDFEILRDQNGIITNIAIDWENALERFPELESRIYHIIECFGGQGQPCPQPDVKDFPKFARKYGKDFDGFVAVLNL